MIEIKNKGKSNLFINDFFANGNPLSLKSGEAVNLHPKEINNNILNNKKRLESLKKYIVIKEVVTNLLKPTKKEETPKQEKPVEVVEETPKQETTPVQETPKQEKPVEVVEETPKQEKPVEVVEETKSSKKKKSEENQ